ncbi:hypothetical protein BHM03_00028597, partial [Ensete ventricosum]
MPSPMKSFNKFTGSFAPPCLRNFSLRAVPVSGDKGSSWHILHHIVAAKHLAYSSVAENLFRESFIAFTNFSGIASPVVGNTKWYRAVRTNPPADRYEDCQLSSGRRKKREKKRKNLEIWRRSPSTSLSVIALSRRSSDECRLGVVSDFSSARGEETRR